MDRQIKQRVVGAAVLVMLGVIFIPIFLDDGGLEERFRDVADLPPPPSDDFGSRVVPLSDSDIEDLGYRTAERLDIEPPVPSESAVGPDTEAIPDESLADGASMAGGETEARESGEGSEGSEGGERSVPAGELVAGLPAPRESVDAWTVQLGSFSNDANAKRLIERLREGGFTAYVERKSESDGTVFKVRVGPQIRREEAEQVRAELEQQFSLKGMLLKYR